jgi:protease-4
MNPLISLPQRQLQNLVQIGRHAARWLALSRGGPLWIEVQLRGGLSEYSSSGSLVSASEPSLGLLDLLRMLEIAGADANVVGVVLRMDGGSAGWSGAVALRRALIAFRARGKKIVAWGSGFDMLHFYIASVCDRIWLPATGNVGLMGLRSEHFYLRDMLDKLDVVPEVVRVGKFKNAGEPLTRSSMSDEQREQIDAWQSDVFDELVAGIAEGRSLAREEIRKLIDRGPFIAKAAIDAGLVDGCLYPDELQSALTGLETAGEHETHEDDSSDARVVKAPNYFALSRDASGWQPLFEEMPSIAYVVLAGNVGLGNRRRGIAAERFGALLEDLRGRSSVCGVVLRVDSPGGDAAASELLYRSVQQLALEKPVVVSMADVAGSGGYFLAAPAHSILAESVTITGSIGVVGGKINMAGLYRKLGVAKDTVERGARAGLYAEDRGFTDEERTAVADSMGAIYDIFVDRVSEGRGLSRDAVRSVAEGRIWSGRAALSVGLVDGLGGPLEALADVRRRVGLADHEHCGVDQYPRRSPIQGLRQLLSTLGE